uniref:Uncharacterized protein n=1 Tax=Malurus cyaneus samueli TaxID=2593467 RepID=A0A8C5UJK4_9PASS
MVVKVCRYRSWRAAGDSVITMAASFRALDAFISPSAAITWGASASAAMALCSCTGNFTSLISTRSTLMPQSSVASSRWSVPAAGWLSRRW